MNIFNSILLGVVQGLTEFLPVSSSAHLAIAQSLIPKFTQPGLLFDVVLHMGTTLAVLSYFRKDILKINLKEIFLLGIATIPAVVAGLLFRTIFESLFTNIHLIGVTLIFTGIMNFFVVKSLTTSTNIDWLDAILIGVAQAIAIIPGISRSGATIFTGVRLGLDRKRVAEFSFLMSVPAIVGANLLEVVSHRSELGRVDISYLGGFLGAFIVGFLSIGFLMKIITHKKFLIFSVYCVILGIVTILLTK